MRLKPTPASLLLLALLSGHQTLTMAQTHLPSIPPNGYYVFLKDGQQLYPNSIRLRHPQPGEKYLVLDNHQHIPVENVGRFHSAIGSFVIIPDSAGTEIYRIEQENKRISLYSKLITKTSHTNDPPFTPSRQLYFKKTEDGNMTQLNYNCLRQVIADNPASLRQLQLATTIKAIGVGLLLVSFITESIGMYKTFKASRFHYQQPAPGQDDHPRPQPHHPASPLMFIGGGGFIAGSVLIFNAHHHFKKALQLYNL